MRRGDVYDCPDGDRIIVKRVARDQSWADIIVIQPSGARWSKRQPLRDGEFRFPATLVAGKEFFESYAPPFDNWEGERSDHDRR